VKIKTNQATGIETSKRLLSLAVIATALSACGTIATTSGPMGIGPDTWRIAAKDGMKGAAGGQRMALAEANAHCQGMTRNIMVIATQQRDPPYGAFEVTYRCLRDGDSELVRPYLEKTPDTVIQIK
jgi:hypothetical protein